jgi:hypothetical protein
VKQMQDPAHKSHTEQWLADMASDAAPGGKIDRGPVETLASKAGHAPPKRNRKGGRVPPIGAAQTRKL